MTQRTFVQCLAAIAVGTLALALWPGSKPHSVEPPSTAMAVTEVRESLETTAPAPPSPSAGTLRRALMAAPSRPAAPSASEARVDAVPVELRVNTAKVLATVNQTPLKLKDLMPVRSDEIEKELTPEQYAFRLQRAIEMELTFQAARDQGVELTAAQQQRVGQVAEGDKSDLEHYKKYGLTWSSSSAEQMEFEKRLLSAQMLEQNLVAKKAALSPSPDPEIQSRYEQARRKLLDQLQASANITKPVPVL